MKKLWLCLAAALLLCLPAGAWDSSGPEPAGYLALTFDDGPSGPITEHLLDGLARRDVHATFFLCGYRMEQYPAPLSRYIAEGHELGVHSTVNADLTRLSRKEVRQDIAATRNQIFAATGVQPLLLRPPGGAYNDTVIREAEAEGLSILLWSMDTRDWSTHDPDRVLRTMARGVEDGDIILMHDMSMSSVEAALELVDDLQARGYRFVTVSELASLRSQALIPGQVYRNFHG